MNKLIVIMVIKTKIISYGEQTSLNPFSLLMDLCVVRTVFHFIALLLACWLVITLAGHHDGSGFSDLGFLGGNILLMEYATL